LPARFAIRFAKGFVPIAIVLGLLYAQSRQTRENLLESILVLLFCAIVLGLGWRWMRGASLTRWAGRILALYLALALVLLGLSVTLTFGEILFLLALLAVPIWLWDLFVRQPHKGRFARARAERRGYEDVDSAFADETPEEHKP
jgi:biotin transporter BioY